MAIRAFLTENKKVQKNNIYWIRFAE